MMSEPSIHIKNFNDKVKLMNQTQRKEIVLSAADARSLHDEIYGLLAQIADLARVSEAPEPVIQVGMDGGGFK
jgi:hypothetical protein